MGIAYRIDQALGATFVVYDGKLTRQDLIDHARRISADPDWPPRRRLQLADVSTYHNPEQLPKPAITEIADFWGKRLDQVGEMHLAVVATLAFDNAKMFEKAMSNGGPNTIVFNRLETACTWLGLPADQARQTLKAIRAELREKQQE